MKGFIAWVLFGITIIIFQSSFLNIIFPTGNVASVVLVAITWMTLTFGWQRVWFQVFTLSFLVDILIDQQVGVFLYYALILFFLVGIVEVLVSVEEEIKRIVIASVLVVVVQILILFSENRFEWYFIPIILISAAVWYGLFGWIWKKIERYRIYTQKIHPKIQGE